jgi:hypothetical protein
MNSCGPSERPTATTTSLFSLRSRVRVRPAEYASNGRRDRKAQTPLTTPKSGGPKKRTFIARARRMAAQIPVRYRANGSGTWHDRAINNLSQSGVLLAGALQLPKNTLVEIVFEMPEEVSGQKNSTVLCQGRILRQQKIRGSDSLALAASILNYKFLRNN